MRYFLFLIILILLGSCRTQKTAVSSNIHASAISNIVEAKDTSSTTEIFWHLDSDSVLFENPSFFNLIRISDSGARQPITRNGYIKITTNTSSTTSAAKSSSADTTKVQKKESPKQQTIYKTDWILSVTLSVLTFIFCQCWQYRKKLAKLFGSLK